MGFRDRDARQRLLGVNIDHVATVRQARGVPYPDIAEAVRLAEAGGADFITAHLREDRRHIQDADVDAIMAATGTWLNLELSLEPEMLAIGRGKRPGTVCLVPERREELTTEGGLEVRGQLDRVAAAVAGLQGAGIGVTLFIDPDQGQALAAKECGADAVEFHTGSYANAADPAPELAKLAKAAAAAADAGLIVNFGHGLTLANAAPVAAIEHAHEFNIGHSIVSRALFVGMGEAVAEMRRALGL